MNKTAKQLWQTLWLLFGGLCSSNIFYAFWVSLQTGPADSPPTPLLQPILLALAVGTVVAAFALAKMFAPPLGEVQPNTEISDEPLTDNQRQALQRLQMSKIVAWALSESIAMYGVIMGVLTHDMNTFWPFLAIALVSFAIQRPNKEQFLGVIAGAHP